MSDFVDLIMEKIEKAYAEDQAAKKPRKKYFMKDQLCSKGKVQEINESIEDPISVAELLSVTIVILTLGAISLIFASLLQGTIL